MYSQALRHQVCRAWYREHCGLLPIALALLWAELAALLHENSASTAVNYIESAAQTEHHSLWTDCNPLSVSMTNVVDLSGARSIV